MLESNSKSDTASIIESKIRAALTPEYLDLVNESHMHGVAPGSSTHFKLTLVSEVFDGLARVKCHQKVYGLLTEELASGVHALALHLYSPQQWQARASSVPSSPECLGGSQNKNPK